MRSIFVCMFFLFPGLWLSAQINWVKRAGGASTDLGNGLWVDAKMQVYVAGSISGQAKFHKTEVFSKGGGDVWVAKYNPEGIPLWIRTFGGKLDDFANALCGDPDGNVYVTGVFTDTAWFENQMLYTPKTDIFAAKLNPKGKLEWVKSLGTLGGALPNCMAVTDQGGLYIGGLYTGPYSDKVSNQRGQTDGFITKLTWDGEISWTKTIGGPGFDEVSMLSTDPWGRVVAGGTFEHQLFVEDQEIQGVSNKSGFLMRFEATGRLLWQKSFSGVDAQCQVADATTDLDGNVYAVGKFSGETDFDAHHKTSKGQTDVFVQKISPKGEVLWVNTLGGSDVEEALNVKFSQDDKSILVSGLFNKVLEFGKKSVSAVFDNQLFVSRWDLRGNLDEVRIQNFNSLFQCAGRKLDGQGNIWLTGSFTEKTTFGTLPFQSVGEEDIFITSISDKKISK